MGEIQFDDEVFLSSSVCSVPSVVEDLQLTEPEFADSLQEPTDKAYPTKF
jgi:hypothetical protein